MNIFSMDNRSKAFNKLQNQINVAVHRETREVSIFEYLLTGNLYGFVLQKSTLLKCVNTSCCSVLH